MLDLMNQVVLLADTASNGSTLGVPIAMAVLTIIGAAFLFGFSLPLFFSTMKTRDTTQLSYLMWGIYIAATFFLGMPALVNSISALSSGSDQMTQINMIPLLVIGIANVVSFFTAVAMVSLKAHNQARAKKAGLTEAEYCKLHNPVLKKQAQESVLEQQAEAVCEAGHENCHCHHSSRFSECDHPNSNQQ